MFLLLVVVMLLLRTSSWTNSVFMGFLKRGNRLSTASRQQLVQASNIGNPKFQINGLLMGIRCISSQRATTKTPVMTKALQLPSSWWGRNRRVPYKRYILPVLPVLWFDSEDFYTQLPKVVHTIFAVLWFQIDYFHLHLQIVMHTVLTVLWFNINNFNPHLQISMHTVLAVLFNIDCFHPHPKYFFTLSLLYCGFISMTFNPTPKESYAHFIGCVVVSYRRHSLPPPKSYAHCLGCIVVWYRWLYLQFHHHQDTHAIAPVPVQHSWWILVIRSHKSIRN